ncbi:MAG: saccharopine dehydrogenase NADP-binding domain-containing protein [Roseiflexaceae bacterium]
MTPKLLIYGAYGYTGELITRQAVERGLRPILSGRDPARVARLAAEYGLEHRAVRLDDPAGLAATLRGVQAVLHCAGPFGQTAAPMATACLRGGVHYLDITGETAVFEALAGRDSEAQAAGVMLLPGAGFDVVPSDCLALHLKARLPGAISLAVAYGGMAQISRGTATTALSDLGRASGLVRRDGALAAVPLAHRSLTIDFGDGPTHAVAIPLGDVVTAYHSTGIPNIEVFLATPKLAGAALRLGRGLVPLMRLPVLRRAALAWVRSRPAGPSAELRARSNSMIWGQVADSTGTTATARLRLPEAYTLTALTAVAIAERVLRGDLRPGFQTPARVYGAEFIMEFDGVTRTDIL